MRTLYPYYQEPTPVWDSDLESPLWHPAAAALRVFTGAPSGGPFMAQPPAASPSAARGSSVTGSGSGPGRRLPMISESVSFGAFAQATTSVSYSTSHSTPWAWLH